MKSVLDFSGIIYRKGFQKNESEFTDTRAMDIILFLNINSGCIHLVDLVTYEVLPCMENELSTEEIVES